MSISNGSKFIGLIDRNNKLLPSLSWLVMTYT